MPMQLGLSVYGAFQLDDGDLYNAMVHSRENKITVWRVGMDWHSAGDGFTPIRSDGSYNPAMEGRLQSLQNFARINRVQLHWTLFQPLRSKSQRERAAASIKKFATKLSGFTAGEISYDVANEYVPSKFPVEDLYALVTAAKQGNPRAPVTWSGASGDPAGNASNWYVLDPIIAGSQYANFNKSAPTAINFACPHIRRNILINGDNQWDNRNETWFKNFTEELGLQGASYLEVWDDEGRREGDQNAGGAGADPTVQERVNAAQGAKNAGCDVHIFHSPMAYTRRLLPSPTELEALRRIRDEVIDDLPPVVEPPTPEPTPEPC